ncbi:MAG: glutamyl-tRNA reductase [Phycisphaeraceae bacterium]
MRILLLGTSHRTAPVALRERLAFSAETLEAVHLELRRRWPQAECVVLSTCNRTEIYVARPTHQPPGGEELRQFLAERCGVGIDDIRTGSIHREREEAVTHLFRVASGIDSMVVGEPQILGQVKRAYETATRCETVGPTLHRVFQQAFAAAKEVRTRTGIGEGAVSVGSVAADFARQIFSDFSQKTIVGIGAGEMAKLTLRHLRGLQPRRLWVVNRTRERAIRLADYLDVRPEAGGARAWDDLDHLLIESDVVIASTGASQPILTAERVRAVQKRRRNRPLFLIDIAVPRDVADDVGSLTNVYLYNIDDLQQAVAANADERREQVEQCERYVREAAHDCLQQIQYRDIGQLIHQLRTRLHEIGDVEHERTVRKLARFTSDECTDEAERIVAEHTRRVINKILHLPLTQLDNACSEAPLAFYAAALRRLFDLDDAERAKQATGKAEGNGEAVRETGSSGSGAPRS